MGREGIPRIKSWSARAAHRPLEHLEQRLLHPLPRHVPRDAHVLGLLRDLVDLVNVHDPLLRQVDVVARLLEQLEQDRLHVLPDVPRLESVQGFRVLGF
jgi:hypothetical protein